MEIRLSLQLAETDLEAIENTIAKALSRGLANGLVKVARILAKEGLLTGLLAQPEATATIPEQIVVPEPPPPAPEPVEPPSATPVAVIFPWELAAKKKVEQPIPDSLPKLPKKRKNRSVLDVCKKVGERPEGYISSTKAYEIMGGSVNSTSGALSTWVITKQIDGVIVYNTKETPTKGLGGGKLYVNAEQLKKRNDERLRNSKLPVKQRHVSNTHMAV